ncbi:MAG: DUF4397 domain-containing protein [candidate division Zixibacteria bacterium]|nr:DUF4397 domain-containing protein [candidate division Zixibacteria bacterium]
MKSKSLIFGLGALTISALLVSGCSDDDDNNIMSSGSNPDQSTVMIIHASPDAPGVDILVDNAKAVTNLGFPQNTGYVNVSAGMRNVKVNATGTSTTVINGHFDLAADAHYSVFAVDSVSKITVLVLSDNLAVPASGKSHVRFVHLSPNAPAVDIGLTGGGVVFPDVAFKEYVDFTPLDAGTYDLEVRLAGTSTVVLPLPGITLQAGKIYTVFAKGFVGGTGDKALGAEIIVNK